MTVSLAFYRGHGRLDDRLIRWATNSPFSHVELVRFPVPEAASETEFTALALSASGRDGGVREKWITFRPGRWEFLPLDEVIDGDEAWRWASAHLGSRYDFLGILLSQALALDRHDKDRWFCSELCAYALGLEDPHRYSPGCLYRRVSYLRLQPGCTRLLRDIADLRAMNRLAQAGGGGG